MPNVWRIKGNQTMKFDQLIDYNMRNIFLKKSYIKCDAETSPRPFSEKLKLSISLDQESKISCSLFLLYAKPKAIEICWNYAADYLHLPHIKLFFQKEWGLELGSLPYFLHNFWSKIFLLIYSINWPSFIIWLSLLRETLGNMCIVIVC